MPIFTYTVTLGAGATTPTLTNPASDSGTGQPFCFLRMESETGNAAIQFGTSAVTSTVYGGSITAGPTNAVEIFSGSLGIGNLKDLFFLGTNGQKIHLFGLSP